ncbi:MAG: (2Fe-2S) ferredoxin domain-containing protein [Calditrichaeota bacterium]|nr:(2Fe-2S) ferredoxin domain-containing protein [Calditrichota bacterium]
MDFPEKHIFVCENKRPPGAHRPSCGYKHSAEIRSLLRKKLSEKGLDKVYRVNKAGCLDKCEYGATVVIYPQGIWYGGVSVEDVDEILEKSILNDLIIERLSLNSREEPKTNE